MRRWIGGMGAALRALFGWAPVWVPLLLLWQVGTRGLRPALAESERLEAEEELVRARHERARAEFEELERRARAWEDPVYRERERRRLEAERGR